MYNSIMNFNPILPEFYVTDFEKSFNFYANILGFKLEYQRENPSFAFLSREGSQIMIQQLWEEEGDEWITGKLEYPFGRGINFQLDTEDLQSIIDSLQKNNYPLQKEVWDSWYKAENVLVGCRQILVKDPDGYLFRFSQGIGTKPVEIDV